VSFKIGDEDWSDDANFGVADGTATPSGKPLPAVRKGEAAKHQCEIDQFSFGVKTPRDPQSGLPTGQRMYDPVAFVKAKGASSTQFYNALVTNEALMVVIFDCYGQDPKSGKIVLAHSVKLTNASVASIGFQMPNLRDPALMKYTDTETITLTFQKVELTGAGGVTAADSWEAQS